MLRSFKMIETERKAKLGKKKQSFKQHKFSFIIKHKIPKKKTFPLNKLKGKQNKNE